MASSEAGQSSPTRESGERKEEAVPSPTSREGAIQETEDECAVCRNDMIEVTTLSDCIHMFCYDCIVGWLTKGSGTFCPMCKAKVTFIKKRDTGEVTTVAQLKAETLPPPIASRNLVTEKRMVARKMRSCRRLMNKLDELISIVHLTNNEYRHDDFVSMKQKVVAQLNALQMIREDIESGAPKAMVVSKVAFRRLIYERGVDADGIETEGLPTRREVLERLEHFRTVFHTFMSVELKALPTKLQPKVDNENGWHFNTVHEELHGGDEALIAKLFDLVIQYGASDLTIRHVENVLNGKISSRVAGVLHNEISSLLTSRMTYLEWCGVVYYRSHLDRGSDSTEHDSEVVVVEDNGDDPPAHDFSRRRISPFNRIFDLAQPSILYNRPEDVSLPPHFSLLTAPLRIQAMAGYRPQAHVVNPTIPRAGIPWDQLTGVATRSRPRRPEVVNLDDDDDIGEPISNSSPSDDVQFVDHDGTIVLGDTPDSRPGPSSRGFKRRHPGEHRRPKRAKMDVPQELVDEVKKLMDRFDMPAREAMNTMMDATQRALDQRKRGFREEEEVDVESVSSSNPKTPEPRP